MADTLESLKSRREYIMLSMSYTAGRAGVEDTGDTDHYRETMREVMRQIETLDKQIKALEKRDA